GYRPQPAYGPTSPYALAPYTYSLQRRRHSRSPQHHPQHAFSASPAYGPGAEYAPAPASYGSPSQAMDCRPDTARTPGTVALITRSRTQCRRTLMLASKFGTKSPIASRKPSCNSGRHHRVVTPSLLHDPQLIRAEFVAS